MNLKLLQNRIRKNINFFKNKKKKKKIKKNIYLFIFYIIQSKIYILQYINN